MKRFTKILSVVLVLSLLASFMAIPASAAIANGDTGFKLTFKDTDGNIVDSVAAGDVVDLYVSMMCNSYAFSWQIMVKYDKVKLAHVRKGSTGYQTITNNNCYELLGIFVDDSMIEDDTDPIWQWEAENVGNEYYYMPGYKKSSITKHTDSMYPTSWSDSEKATYNCINASYQTNVTDSVLLVNTEGEYEDWVRFRFYAYEDTKLDATAVDIISDPAKTVFNLEADGSIPISAAATGQTSATSISITRAEVAATPDVYKLADTQKHQMSDGSYRTCSYFAFDATTIDPDFVVSDDPEVNGHSNYIKGITATVTLNGNPVDAAKIPTIRFVYDLKNGSYGFRVILNGAEADDVITITPVLTTDDNATFTTETISFKVADVAAV